MEIKYYIFGYSDYIKNSIADILTLPNVTYYDAFKAKTKWEYAIHRVFISRYVHTFSRLIMPIWKNKYWLSNKPEKDKEVVAILYENNPLSNKQEWIESTKESYPNMRFVYIFTNIIDDNNMWRLDKILKRRDLYDLVLTFNKSDAEKYGLDYYEGVFSCKTINNDLLEAADICDVYFCGLDKGRMKTLIQIYRFLENHGVKCLFDITYPQSDVEENAEGIRLHSTLLNNEKMLANVKKARCVLEVMVDRSQPGSSLRMCEAIVYRRKLLTNNPFVSEKPFYNKKQMYFFDKPEDIDINFIYKELESDEYLPVDLLSPTKMLDFIENRVIKNA